MWLSSDVFDFSKFNRFRQTSFQCQTIDGSAITWTSPSKTIQMWISLSFRLVCIYSISSYHYTEKHKYIQSSSSNNTHTNTQALKNPLPRRSESTTKQHKNCTASTIETTTNALTKLLSFTYTRLAWHSPSQSIFDPIRVQFSRRSSVVKRSNKSQNSSCFRF